MAAALTDPQLEPFSRETRDAQFDWRNIAHIFLVSRALDDLEETKLFPEKKVLYQFSARGHELAQILLGSLLTGAHDGVSPYYRSRPLMLTLGLQLEDALASGMAKSGGISDGRDIGVVFNLPRANGVTVLPMAGGVGTQYTPNAGWARAIQYYRDVLRDFSYRDSIAVACGGEGSVATNGFWSALNLAATIGLPMLFFIEDNGYGISVPATKQTPGGNIARNLDSFGNLRIFEADGCNVLSAVRNVTAAVDCVREGHGPALLRVSIPRLCGHSGQDSQAYKSADVLAGERSRDPIHAIESYLVPDVISKPEWDELARKAEEEAALAADRAWARRDPDPSTATRFVFAPEHTTAQDPAPDPSEPARLNMVAAIRRTLQHELETNPRALIFGEDVGHKGGVHTATQGLLQQFGEPRVYDTSLSEEGIIGSAVGMALAGLRPIAEIQFRKYSEPATEQLVDCGTLRWRTAGKYSAPIVVRMPGGFSKCGDPWHSMSNEVFFAHAVGWRVIIPSNAEDAVGLLRSAMRSPNPTIFFEHRHLLDSAWARRPYPGNDYVIPLGRAKTITSGTDLTVVTWGALVERCVKAAQSFVERIEVVDLRTIVPWDRSAVLASVKRTHRCLVVHEDTLTAGFGAEIAAIIGKEAFTDLDAPIDRLSVPDVPLPYNVGLLNAVLPGVSAIEQRMRDLLAY